MTWTDASRSHNVTHYIFKNLAQLYDLLVTLEQFIAPLSGKKAAMYKDSTVFVQINMYKM